MAALASLLSFSPLPLLHSRRPRCFSVVTLAPLRPTKNPRKLRTTRTLVFASSASSVDDLYSNEENSRSKKSFLLNLIQEIEPLDVSLIQKDVPPTTVDAMKRTISGMLGLLPSDQFQVSIEALWEPLSKLLVSSMMTGYTLRNAEYRLCLERNFDRYEGSIEKQKTEDSKLESQRMLLDNEKIVITSKENELPKSQNIGEVASENIGIQGLGEITAKAQQYILNLRSRLSSVEKELREVKRKTAALQMQQFVGEEKNDLLDYLRSLQPEKVAELSEPTCPELKETIHSVVHGLLATLSPKMHSKAPPLSENTPTETVNVGIEEDCVDLVENTSLQFQPLISLTRDYLARLLFWCMLLGHNLRGLEYRLELMKLLSLPNNVEDDACGGEQVA
uniref:MAR-binding filament-like protein 1 n=1 Tax=Davidia involucrata TaxID=16924 RepID=A0A5B6ZG69_DAVIN